MDCHDIRKWRICEGCKEPGHSGHMIPTDLAWWHGRCYVTEFGEDRFLKLPNSHVGGLTLDDIGQDLMRLLLNRQAVPTDSQHTKE